MHKYATMQHIAAVLVPTDASRRLRRAIAKRHKFDFTPRQGYLYVRSRAISSRTNDNYDEFPAAEIKTAYRSFIGKPVFVNHVNDDHKRARGVIIDAALHEDTLADGSPDTWAEVLMEVDAVGFPKLAKAIIEKRIDRTSMGCDVAYSICSACGNKASTPAEYCVHIPRLKGKKIIRANAATGQKETHLIRETCYGLGFFENSLLVEEPADPTAFFLGVEDHSGLSTAASRKTVANLGHLHLGNDDEPCANCGSDAAHHPHLTTGPWARCSTCGKDMSHSNHEPGLVAHLDAQRQQMPMSPEEKRRHVEDLFTGPHSQRYESDDEKGIADQLKDLGGEHAGWALDRQEGKPSKFSLLQHFAGKSTWTTKDDVALQFHMENPPKGDGCSICGDSDHETGHHVDDAIGPRHISSLMRHFADAKVIPFEKCYCDEPDVYDGYAECPRHPDGQKTSAKKDTGPSVSGVVLKAADTGRILMLQRGLDDKKDPAAGTSARYASRSATTVVLPTAGQALARAVDLDLGVLRRVGMAAGALGLRRVEAGQSLAQQDVLAASACREMNRLRAEAMQAGHASWAVDIDVVAPVVNHLARLDRVAQQHPDQPVDFPHLPLEVHLAVAAAARWASPHVAGVTSAKSDAAGDAKRKFPEVSGVCLKAADTGRVLMLQRGMDDAHDPAKGTWEWPGGHHEDGDTTSLHAGIREWEEEVGQKFPEGGYVAHTWQSPNGIYQGHVIVIPSEKDVVLHDGRVTPNPDDPKGDKAEQAAWWDPDHARKNPALRTEVKSSPWGMVKKATYTTQDFGRTVMNEYDRVQGLDAQGSRHCEECGGSGQVWRGGRNDSSRHKVDCPQCGGSGDASSNWDDDDTDGAWGDSWDRSFTSAKHHHKTHHHHKHPASHPHFLPRIGWTGGWGMRGFFGGQSGYCCPGGSCVGVDTVEGADGAAGGDSGGDSAGGGDGGGGATASRRTATWVGDDPDEPTKVWAAPKSGWAVHIKNFHHDEGNRQSVVLRAPNGTSHYPNRDGSGIYSDCPRIPDHVQNHIQRAHDLVDQHAEDHANIHDQFDLLDNAEQTNKHKQRFQREFAEGPGGHEVGRSKSCEMCSGSGMTSAGICHGCDGSGRRHATRRRTAMRSEFAADHPALGPVGAQDRPLTPYEAARLGPHIAERMSDGLVRHDIKAGDVQEGDRLDASGRTRVDQRHPRTDTVLVRTQSNGARSPSVQKWHPDDDITVWRKQSSLRKQADEDQCPFCAGDSLMSQGSYTCEDGHRWSPDEPAAKAFHDGPGELQPYPERTTR